MVIIGITGTNGAGKGTIADYLLSSFGYSHFSVRGLLIEELVRRGREVDRQGLIDVANEMRAEQGPAVLVEELYGRAVASGGNCVIESLRCPGEVEALRKKPDFYLVAVDAEQDLRFKRNSMRGSVTDNETFESFVEKEKQEMDSKEPFKQNISWCVANADYLLLNNRSLNTFENNMEHFFGNLDEQGRLTRRPTYSEIAMLEAYVWSARSTCLRRKTGAVILNEDNEGISQGYNGSPRGIDNCIDLGYCERQKQNIPSGQRLEVCNAVHAEANSILNAGRQGRSVVGATMYATTYPCSLCAGLIVNSGIRKVTYDSPYPEPNGKRILSKAQEKGKIEVVRFEGVKPRAFNRLFQTA